MAASRKFVGFKSGFGFLHAVRGRGRKAGFLLILACLLAALFLVPVRVDGQGLDPCCSIMSLGLKTISLLLSGQVARPLSDINALEQQNATLRQQIVYPLSAINSARGAVTQIEGQIRTITQINSVPVNSATLPDTQQLESVLLSHSSGQISNVGQVYLNIYGKTPSTGNAPQGVRNAMDMADAEAQAALKKALQLDALADIEVQAANKLTQQIQTAAPGSAPILEVEAAALRIRAEAYTQSATAELVRLKAIELAGNSADLKFASGNNTALRGDVGGMLGQGK